MLQLAACLLHLQLAPVSLPGCQWLLLPPPLLLLPTTTLTHPYPSGVMALLVLELISRSLDLCLASRIQGRPASLDPSAALQQGGSGGRRTTTSHDRQVPRKQLTIPLLGFARFVAVAAAALSMPRQPMSPGASQSTNGSARSSIAHREQVSQKHRTTADVVSGLDSFPLE